MTILSPENTASNNIDDQNNSVAIVTDNTASQHGKLLSPEQEKLSNYARDVRGLSNNHHNRPSQTETYTAMADSIERGEQHGIAKLPTGTGKTRIFANMIHVLQMNGLILVPRVDLYNSTKKELLEAGFLDKNIILPHEADGKNAGQKLIAALENPDIDWSSGQVAVVMTYQALISIFKSNADKCKELLSRFGVVVNDEAHRGLGDKTQSASKELMSSKHSVALDFGGDDSGDGDISLENEVIGVVQEAHVKFQWFFTATPGLYGKSVEDISQYIIYKRVEEVIREGAIVLPQHITVGDAYPNNEDTIEKWKVKDIEKISDGCGFIDEKGDNIQEKIIDQYESLRQAHEVLPGVAFASTITHAQKIVEAFQKRGIRATRVTSAKGDTTSQEAIRMMDDNELDVIVTVSKVAEGFDYPPLSCAMWFAPSLSPAKLMQGNGRVMRTTEEKAPESTTDKSGKLIASPNTYIIEPRSWRGSRPRNETPTKTGTISGQTKNGEKKSSGGIVGNSFEVFTKNGEIGANNLSAHSGIDVENFGLIHGEIYERGGVKYGAIDVNKKFLGLDGSFIVDALVPARSIPVIGGKGESDEVIYLVELQGIRNFIGTSYTGFVHEEEVKIEGISYMVIEKEGDYKGMSGEDVWNAVINRKNESLILQGLTSNGQKQKIIPINLLKENGLFGENFVNTSKYTLDIGGFQAPTDALLNIAKSLKTIFDKQFLETIRYDHTTNSLDIDGDIYLYFENDTIVEGVSTLFWREFFPSFFPFVHEKDFLIRKEGIKKSLDLEPGGKIKLGERTYTYIHPNTPLLPSGINGGIIIQEAQRNHDDKEIKPFKEGYLIDGRYISTTLQWIKKYRDSIKNISTNPTREAELVWNTPIAWNMSVTEGVQKLQNIVDDIEKNIRKLGGEDVKITSNICHIDRKLYSVTIKTETEMLDMSSFEIDIRKLIMERVYGLLL